MDNKCLRCDSAAEYACSCDLSLRLCCKCLLKDKVHKVHDHIELVEISKIETIKEIRSNLIQTKNEIIRRSQNLINCVFSTVSNNKIDPIIKDLKFFDTFSEPQICELKEQSTKFFSCDKEPVILRIINAHLNVSEEISGDQNLTNELKCAIQKLSQSNTNFSRNYQIFNEKYEKLKSRVTEVEAEKNSLISQKKELKEQIKTITTDFQAAEKNSLLEKENLQNSKIGLERKIKDLNKSMKEKSTSLQNKIVNLENSLKSSKNEYEERASQYEAKIKELQNIISDFEGQIKITREKSDCELLKKKLKLSEEKHQNTIKQLQAENKKLKTENKDFKNKLKSSEDKEATLLNSLNESNQKFTEEISTLKVIINNLSEKNKSISQENAELQESIENLHSEKLRDEEEVKKKYEGGKKNDRKGTKNKGVSRSVTIEKELASFRTSEKVDVKKEEMTQGMKNVVLHLTENALATITQEKDIARHIREEMDKVYGPKWHCVVGKNLENSVTYENNCYIYFFYKKLGILLFK